MTLRFFLTIYLIKVVPKWREPELTEAFLIHRNNALTVYLSTHDRDRFLIDASRIPLLDNFEIRLTFLKASAWFPTFFA